MSTPTNRSQRYALAELFVVYDTNEAYLSAPVVDMSTTGVQLASDTPLQEGSVVQVLFESPQDDLLPMGIDARVVRCIQHQQDPPFGKPYALAFQFEFAGRQERNRVALFLRDHGLPLSDATNSPPKDEALDRDTDAAISTLGVD